MRRRSDHLFSVASPMTKVPCRGSAGALGAGEEEGDVK